MYSKRRRGIQVVNEGVGLPLLYFVLQRADFETISGRQQVAIGLVSKQLTTVHFRACCSAFRKVRKFAWVVDGAPEAYLNNSFDSKIYSSNR